MLGMRVTRDLKSGRSIYLDQLSSYRVDARFTRYGGMQPQGCTGASRCSLASLVADGTEVVSSVDSVAPVSSESSEELKREYQSIIGKLHYITHSTRPDIAHAVNQLSSFQAAPTSQHLEAAYYCVRYLRGTTQLALEFGCLDSSSSPGVTAAVDVIPVVA